jgi:hypothetical protein
MHSLKVVIINRFLNLFSCCERRFSGFGAVSQHIDGMGWEYVPGKRKYF